MSDSITRHITPNAVIILMEARVGLSFQQGQSWADNATNELVEMGLVEVFESTVIGVTPRGSMYVDMLISTPLPVKDWVDPRKV